MRAPIIDRIERKKRQLDKLRPLPHSALDRLRAEISVEWTYNSNAIEGNTLTLRETLLVIEHGITIGGKALREHFEINNHQHAIKFVESLAASRRELTEQNVLEIHRIVLDNIEMEYAGRYRSGQVRIIGANFIPPNQLKIPGLITDLIAETNTNCDRLSTVELAARFHHRFVWIHPFFDGNGRTARLLMNLLLMREGFPPAIILFNDRGRYYRALESANNGQYDQFILLVAQAVERSLDIYLESTGVIGIDEYVPLSILATKFPYSQEYLSLLARKGKIDAHKKSRNWLSTEKAINDYLETLSR